MPGMKVSKLIDDYLEKKYGSESQRRLDDLRFRLLKVLSLVGVDRDIHRLRLEDFERAQAALCLQTTSKGKKFSPNSVHHYMRGVRTMFNWAVERRLLTYSPLKNIKLVRLPQPEPKGISQQTFEALVQAAGDVQAELYYWLTVRDVALLALMRDGQCPPAAVCGMKIDDVDLRNRRARVLMTAAPGVEKPTRWVQLSADGVASLRRWVEVRRRVALPAAGGDLFIGQERDRGVGQSTIYYLIERLIVRAGTQALTDIGMATKDEYRRLKKAAADGSRYLHQWQQIRDVALLYVLRDTGARVGGVVTATIDNLDLVRGRLMVHEKGDKFRNVYLTPTSVEKVEAWLAIRDGRAQPGAGRLLFFRADGRAGITTNGVRQLLRKLAKRASVSDSRWNPHSFRHGFARDLLANGIDLSRVSRMLGHSNINVTASYYARWADEELHAAHSQASPLRRHRNARAKK